MTTIIADASLGVMCSDSQWSDDDEKGSVRKVWRIKGALVGFAGDMDQAAKAREFISGRGPAPCGNVTALWLGPEGLRVWTPSDGWLDIGPVHAIGSGSKAARAAHFVGATPQQAIRAAAAVDAGTGGRVRTYWLAPRRHRKG